MAQFAHNPHTKCGKWGRGHSKEVAVPSYTVNIFLSSHRLAGCEGFSSVG